MKYLYNSTEIRDAIHQVFSSKDEKLAVVGFVGYRALEQLPRSVQNLNVICWPRAGATHPDGVRRLIVAGIKVYFCKNLHSKIYWSKGKGVVIGSANLSENALGISRQHEFAVHIPDKAFDIEAVLRSLNYKIVDEKALHTLDLSHNSIRDRHPDCDKDEENAPSYLEALNAPLPKAWKLVTWYGARPDSSHIENAVTDEFGVRKWVNDNDVDPGLYEVGDFVLQVHVDEGGKVARANSKWLRVDLIVDNGKKSPAIVQVGKLEEGSTPPFLNDSKFNKKFKELFNTIPQDQIVGNQAKIKKSFSKKLGKLLEDV